MRTGSTRYRIATEVLLDESSSLSNAVWLGICMGPKLACWILMSWVLWWFVIVPKRSLTALPLGQQNLRAPFALFPLLAASAFYYRERYPPNPLE